MSKILIVEDDLLISKAMDEILDNHKIFHAYDGQTALNMINSNHFDLILLDLMLPKLNGIEIVKNISLDIIPTIIVISAKTDLQSELDCYKLGIRNYIYKPVEYIKLKTIVESVLNPNSQKGILKYKNIKLDLSKKQVFLDNTLIPLTPKEYQLFNLLYKKQGQTICRDEILDEIWGIECDINTRVVDVNIQKLRSNLNLEKEIVTVSKVGYRLEKINET